MKALLYAAIAAAVLVGCGQREEQLVVTDAWTRPTPAGRTEAAIYLTVVNHTASADRLLAASSPACMVVTPHLTEIVNGVATMTESGGDELDVGSGGRLVMEPNGMHLMCLGLSEELIIGGSFSATLTFANAGDVVIDVAVEQR